VLVLSSVLLLLIAGSAAAADTTAPAVAVPEDVPGADVIVFIGDTYQFDASDSSDDTGIVMFQWDFNDAGNPISLTDSTGYTNYTFTSYGQTWVMIHAWDAAGNEGLGFFSIDVAEEVTGNVVIRDQVGILDHSLYVRDGDVTIDNSTVYFAEGAGGLGGGGGSAAPDHMGESLTPRLPRQMEVRQPLLRSALPGREHEVQWRLLDQDIGWKLLLRNGVLLRRGRLTWWFKSSYRTYPYYLEIYFWGAKDYYGSPYMRIYQYGMGYYASYYGWYGTAISLDTQNVHYTNWYGGMSDLSNIYGIRFRMYGYRYMSNLWFDHVGFANIDETGDPITDSVTPGGDLAGRWTGGAGSISLSSNSYAGDYSVGFYVRQYSYHSFTYTFDQPVDLSEFDAIRFYTYFSSYYYTYWYSPQFYVYSSTGYGYYYIASSAHINYYASYYYGKWDMRTLPWGPQSGLMYNSGIDWTQITQISINNVRPYRTGTFLLDGFDWVVAGEAGPSGPTDTVSLAIYNKQGDTTIQGNSMISGMGPMGARILTEDGDATFSHAQFDNIWATKTIVAGNGLNVYGGLEVYGDAYIDNVTFTNCIGPGLALYDGKWTIDQETVDLHGTTMKMKTSPMVILGISEASTGNMAMDVTGWVCEDSPVGTGILISTESTTASIDLTIGGNDLDNNAYAGIVISNTGGGLYTSTGEVAGTTADLDLIIKDQVIEDSGEYGIVYYAGGGTYDPAVWGTLWIENVTVRKSGESGLGVWLDMGGTNLDTTIINSTFERNSGMGAGFQFTSFFGEASVNVQNTSFRDNSGNGFEVYTNMGPYDDGAGNLISPVSSIDFEINASSFQGNSGWGIMERLSGWDDPMGGSAPPWAWNGPTRTTLWYNMTVMGSQIIENQGGGWYSKPEEGWFHGDFVGTRDISDTMFTDNRGSALYIQPYHDLANGGGSVYDVYMLEDCRLLDNAAGVVNNLASNNFGYYGEVHLTDTRLEDNDGNSIYVASSWSTDGVYKWGLSRVMGMMYFIDGCRINTPMNIELLGADDSGGEDWDAIMGLQFTNNIVDIEDETTTFHLGAYPGADDFTAWADIGNNKWYRGFPNNGVDLEMFGGWNLDMDATLHDMVISEPVGSGINIVAGTLVSSAEPHKVTGKVMIDNVTVSDAGSNGINFTIDQREQIGSKSLAELEVHDMVMDNVEYGIYANDAVGAIYDTIINEPRGPSVNLQYCTFDFYSCEVGPVDISNIRVLTKGAARLWYDLGVDVKWASGARVMGAVVSVQDNTWSTIAVDTVSEDAVLNIGYVNSYTVLPDTTYSKSPFVLSGTYLGLATEKSVDIQSNVVVDLILVDDVLPRLTVNTPMDGDKQRETSLTIKGHAWDMHSGLDKVLISIDEFTWFEATGSPDFEFYFDSVPEGNLLVMVKAVDFAGNEHVATISILVDATPPTIIIIEPKNDIFATQTSTLDIIGVTEMGATVLIDNEVVTPDHTLFSTTITLKEGMNEVRVVAVDRLGNTAVHVITVELDTIAPPLIITAPMDGSTLGDHLVSVSGQTEEGAMVYVDGALAANTMGVFRHSTMLSEGPNVITVTSVDAVGNTATATVDVMIDTTAPWLQLATPRDGDVFGTDGIVVTGWVETGSMVTINDQEVTVENAYFTANIAGKEGLNIIVVTVSDLAGNEYSDTVQVWYDTTAPVIDLWTPEDGTMTTDDTIEVTGELMWNEEREGFRDITLTINGDFAPFAADGEFRVQYDLVEGTNPLFIRAEDDVGNSVVITLTVMKDTIAPFLLVEPTPTFDHPTWNKPSTYNSIVYIEGTTEPGAMVTVDGANVEVDATGAFNVSLVLEDVAEGEELVQRSVLVVSTDAAGNSKEETVDVYRLQQEEEDPGFGDYEAAQYWVLLLSIIILIVAIVAATFLWKRIGMREDEYEDDMYLEEV
jgi:hypothetical protein